VNMRRFAIVASTVLLSACGAVVQQTQPTPQQVVDTASQKMGQLRSAKFDLTATILEQFPAAFAQSLGPQGAALQNLSIDLSGKGQISFPDKAAMAVQVKTGSVSVSTDLVIAAGRIYVKDPQSGSYVQAQGTGNVSQFTNQTDPLSAAALLKAAQSVKDLGGTSVGGTAVHHYQIVLDKNKVADQASTQAARDLMRQVLQNGTIQLEAWIGTDDQLLRRVKEDTDARINLGQLLQTLGSSQLPSGLPIPSDATVHTAAHVTIDYHDFNTPVTVSVPSASPS